MTPIEKAEHALNLRIARLQANLGDARSEAAQRFVFQALVVSVGLGEALKDFIRMIGQHAQERHGALQQAQAALTAQHAAELKSGRELLERLKADPADRAIRREIERLQKSMERIQKTLRRGAHTLQRETAPGLALLDPLALTLRRLGEADGIAALKRVTQGAVGHVRAFYHAQSTLPARDLVEAAAWEESAAAQIDQATDFNAAYACAGSQVMLALDLMTMAVSPAPPRTVAEATQRAQESAAARLKAVTARLTQS